MSDRGEYRAIRRVLLNGKDFRKLPERARFAFLALKLNVGPSGIDTFEPEALIVTLAAQMGAKADQVRIALDALEHEGWLHREDNVLWIVGQLEHDPHVKPNDPKHRKAIQRHVAGLPRLGIVRDYVVAHADWFDDVEGATKALPETQEGPSLALHRPFDGPSKHKTENKPEDEREPEGLPAARSARDAVLAHHKRLHPRAKHDDAAKRKVDKALGLGFDADELCLALDAANADPWCLETGNTGFGHVFKNAETIGRYIAKAGATGLADGEPPNALDGWYGPGLEEATRPPGYRPPRIA